MADAKRDENRIPTLLGTSSVDGTTPVLLYADPTTHRLYVDASGVTDEKVKYDAADPTAGYLADKTVAGTGIALAEGTGGNANKLQITNSAPDQTVSLSNGTGITTSGTYPSFTITNSAPFVDAASDGNTYGRKNGAWSAVVAGTGDVIGPATNTDGYIPQWNGANSKTLKNGIDPATLLTVSTASSTYVPYTGASTDLDLNAKSFKNFFVSKTADVTAKMTFDVGGLSTGTIRTLTVPDRSFTLDNITTSTTTAGTGFVKGNGSVISFDNSTYLTALPALTSANIWVGNGSNVATAVALSGDASLSNAGVLGVNKTRLNVRNETGAQIVSTRAVYVSGFNNFPLISLASNTVEVQHNVVGVTIAPINDQSNGFIAVTGQCDAETNAWTVGTELYLSTNGVLTSTAPTSGSVRHVGIVTVQANYPTGKLLIYQFPEENYLAGGTGVDTILRTGDNAGANKFSFRNYANTEVASIDSLGTTTAPIINASTGFRVANAAASGKILKANGTNFVASTETYAAPGTSGNVMTSDGTNWTSATPVGGTNLTLSFTAEENVTAGEPVGISNLLANKVGKAFGTAPAVAHGITTPLFVGPNQNNNQRYCPIGGDKFIWSTYTAATTDTLFVQAGTIDPATKTFTLGTAATVATAFTPEGTTLRNVAICKLDTDKFIIIYLLDASTTVIKYRIGTVSGNTITLGTEATAVTAASTVANSVAFGADFISTDKGVFFYKCATTADSRIVVFTASGTVATFGTPVTLGTQSTTNTPSMVRTIATDKFVLVTGDAANSVYAQVGTCSGTTITMGTEAQISTATSATSVSGLYVVSPATDVFVVRTPSSATVALIIACTVSTRTITAGTPVATGAGASGFGTNGGLFMPNASTVYITGTGTTLGIAKMTLSGTTLTLVTGFVMQKLPVSPLGTLWLDNGYAICLASDATNLSLWIEGMSNSFIGIAQSTVNRASAVNVIVRGKDANQTGLEPGAIYTVTNGALTFASNGGTVAAQTDTFIVKALSATEIVI